MGIIMKEIFFYLTQMSMWFVHEISIKIETLHSTFGFGDVFFFCREMGRAELAEKLHRWTSRTLAFQLSIYQRVLWPVKIQIIGVQTATQGNMLRGVSGGI